MRKDAFRTISRTCGIIVLCLTLSYLLLALLPFYGNGINLHSYQEISGSLVDVKGYPPFAWFLPLQGFGMLAAGFAPLISLLLTPVLLINLGLNWKSLRRIETIVWSASCVANIMTMALTWQVRGIILVWLAD